MISSKTPYILPQIKKSSHKHSLLCKQCVELGFKVQIFAYVNSINLIISVLVVKRYWHQH